MDIKQDSTNNDVRIRPLIFLDLEMTGLRVQKHEIIEIGALKVNPVPPFDTIQEFEVKVKPERLEDADKDALKIVGFTEEEWKDAESLTDALEKLDKFAEGGIIVGFNVTNDWAMLEKAYFSLGRQDPFHFRRMDVMSMAYLVLFNEMRVKRFGLGELCRFLGVPRDRQHRALDDARVTYLVFKKLFDYTKGK